MLKDRKSVIITEKAQEDNTQPHDHIIYYNAIHRSIKNIDLSNTHAHICIFIDYNNIASYKPQECKIIPYDHQNENWHKDLLNVIAENLQKKTHKEFSIICQKPPIQTIKFIFAATKDLKIASIKLLNKHNAYKETLVFVKDQEYASIDTFVYIKTIPDTLNCSNLIMADLDVGVLDKSIMRFSVITIIYTPEDFPILINLVELFDRSNIPVPEHILKLARQQYS